MKQTKPCKHCGKEFEKPYTKSQRDWETRSKYCSRSCLRKNTIPGFTGHTHTEEAKEINRQAHTGERSPTWKGGIDKHNRKERARYRGGIRKEVFERDNFACVECMSTQYLTIDHIKPFSEYPELRFDVDNCRTLCMRCHYKASFGRELAEGMVWGINKNITHTG